MNKHIRMIAALLVVLPSASVVASEVAEEAPVRKRNVKHTTHVHRTEHRHHNHNHRHHTAEDRGQVRHSEETREQQREYHSRYHNNRHANLHKHGTHGQQLPAYRTLDPERTSGKHSPMRRNAPVDRYHAEDSNRRGRSVEYSGKRSSNVNSERHRHIHNHDHIARHRTAKAVAE